MLWNYEVDNYFAPEAEHMWRLHLSKREKADLVCYQTCPELIQDSPIIAHEDEMQKKIALFLV